ncbi:unnamed protein product, partial [marine sediment metagenome]
KPLNYREIKMQKPTHLILAYYKFTPLADPKAEVKTHKKFFKDRDIVGRIYISEQGINGQVSGSNEDAQAYMDWMLSRPEFSGLDFKPEGHHCNIFERMTVKYREQLAALDYEKSNFTKQATHLNPEEWKQVLDEEEPIVLDVRNDYEWEVGHFKDAVSPPCKTFREFQDFANKLRENTDPNKKILMYCTGGIRCEAFSPFMKDLGFKNIYQLKGGVIGYGQKVGSRHWDGKLFVFDDRMTIPISDEETKTIGQCHCCKGPTSDFFNCANMDC